jgi:5-methylcytosine-specific restriction endonuclease McrA
METHHKIHVANGGSNKYNNLVLLHLHCYDQYHAKFAKIKHEERRNNKNLASSYQEMSDIQAEILGIV